MKKWWKIILGLVLIGAALAAMYFWNQKGREKLAEAQPEISEVVSEIVVKDPVKETLKAGLSFFPIKSEWINTKSSKLKVGDIVAIYAQYPMEPEYPIESEPPMEPEYPEIEDLGSFEVAVLTENTLEIACTLENYLEFEKKVQQFNCNFIIVMEAVSE